MKEKKTSVITFRCTENTKIWLEEEAERHNWTIAKLAAHIVENVAKEKEINLENDSKDIFEFVKSDNCKTLSDLIDWAIKNKKTGDVNRTLDIWHRVIEEKNTQK